MGLWRPGQGGGIAAAQASRGSLRPALQGGIRRKRHGQASRRVAGELLERGGGDEVVHAQDADRPPGHRPRVEIDRLRGGLRLHEILSRVIVVARRRAQDKYFRIGRKGPHAGRYLRDKYIVPGGVGRHIQRLPIPDDRITGTPGSGADLRR